MKLLIIGGTQFVGRHLAKAALSRHWEVTLFNRGKTQPGLFKECEEIHGDRTEGLSALAHRHWDAVIDPSGYLPHVIRNNVRTLSQLTDHYTFISSISAYASFAHGQNTEISPVAPLPAGESTDTLTPGNYGPLKGLCEQVAEEEMPQRVFTIRPGLIVGPYDPSDRFTYWCRRIVKGGEILAPGRPDLPLQLIDARDLAEWTLDSVQNNLTGIYNAVGPRTPLTLGQFLNEARHVLNPSARFIWAEDQFLSDHDVQPWIEMPLYIPESGSWIDQHGPMQGFLKTSITKAIQAGLTFRPLSETLRDTWQWEKNRTTPLPQRTIASGKKGLEEIRERELLQLLRQRNLT
ncbi:NAD-dependent epimerase/dehydratase family protein [Marininema halotolerans]|uniref:2'-hydroxyisoflavone reductase n=1 Tax=Marininema halotolerans TaxID=1155944 RepID=A0A1I6U787_9BACL|nr:NAD-dependent epimerase/dehydratase family protein [Marininema halotolerans]SFS97294.1 2'-hydroxyisoflavone reductase [Marininema halotolerans]